MKLPKLFSGRSKKGLGTVGVIVGVLVTILIAAALIPIIESELTSANLSATVKTLLELSPLLVAVVIIIAILRAGKIGSAKGM